MCLQHSAYQKNFAKKVDKMETGWYNNSRCRTQNKICGGLAQLGERLHGMQEVSGSIPLFSTNEEQDEHDGLHGRRVVRLVLFYAGFGEAQII